MEALKSSIVNRKMPASCRPRKVGGSVGQTAHLSQSATAGCVRPYSLARLLPTLLGCLGLVCVAGFSGTVHASDYRIEAVVFEWADGPRTDEIFEQRPDAPVSMPRVGAAPNNIVQNVKSSRLSSAVAKMREAGSIRVIKHRAWTQSRAGKRGSPQIDMGGDEPGLSGWVRLYTNTYLFANVDMALANSNAGPGNNSSGYSSGTTSQGGTPTFTGTVTSAAPYRINEQRRVKFNELHYFDHPAFGVLLVISPNK